SITDTAGRVRREREQLRLIARAMYAQPRSVLMAVLSARSLGDALTSFSDLTAAGERAAAAERRLDQDLSTLRAERAALVADRQRADQLRRQLDVLFRVLQAAAAAGVVQAQAQSQPAVVPRPSAAPTPSSAPRAPATPPPAPAPPPATTPPSAPPPPAPSPPPVAPGSVQQVI